MKHFREISSGSIKARPRGFQWNFYTGPFERYERSSIPAHRSSSILATVPDGINPEFEGTPKFCRFLVAQLIDNISRLDNQGIWVVPIPRECMTYSISATTDRFPSVIRYWPERRVLEVYETPKLLFVSTSPVAKCERNGWKVFVEIREKGGAFKCTRFFNFLVMFRAFFVLRYFFSAFNPFAIVYINYTLIDRTGLLAQDWMEMKLKVTLRKVL